MRVACALGESHTVQNIIGHNIGLNSLERVGIGTGTWTEKGRYHVSYPTDPMWRNSRQLLDNGRSSGLLLWPL
jgi:hypothetical protein